MAADAYTRRFTVTRVVDGDTLIGDVDLGYHTAALAVTYRLLRVDTPELTSKDADVRAAARDARAYTADWLVAHADHDGLFAASTKTDNWRRYLAEITCGQDHNLGDDLLASEHAVLYRK